MRFSLITLFVPSIALGLSACGDDEPTDSDIVDDTDDSGETDTNVALVYPDNVDCGPDVNPCVITGAFGTYKDGTGADTTKFTLTADKQWLLDGPVQVGSQDGTECFDLTVEPGTTVFGATGKRSFLVVHRCSKLFAVGTATDPIIFTSAKNDGERNPGDWGGIILNGRGLNNLCADPNDCNVDSEGGEEAGQYGGNSNTDNSGELKYVRVEFGGDQVTDEDQLNGIAFQAVGSGTKVEYIQVHRNKDDGIEFFGGAAQVKYAVITGATDDSIDWTGGWTGKLQHAVVHQATDAADRGVEADNNEANNAATPRSKPIMSHVTLIGAGTVGSDGMTLRRGTAGNFYSVLVVGFAGECVDVDDSDTYANAFKNGALTGELTMSNSIVGNCKADFKNDDGAAWKVSDWYSTLNSGNRTTAAAADVVENPSYASPNWKSKGAALSGGAAPSDSWFDKGAHVGGVAATDWTAGWTTKAAN
jgi:hypothetical protein